MASYSNTPFEVVRPDEKIPAKVTNRLPDKNKIIRSSTVERATPTSQASINWDAGTPSSTNFNISSKGFFMDPDNASLCFSVKVRKMAGAANTAWDPTNLKLPVLQNVLALIASAQLKVGGITTDDIMNVEASTKQELLVGTAEPWYNTVGYNQMKLWDHAATATATKKEVGQIQTGATPNGLQVAEGLYARYLDAVKIYYDVSTPATPVSLKVHCELPLSMLFGLFRMEQYIPLAFLNGMEITLNWAPVQQCLFCPNKTEAATGVLSLELEKLRVIYRAIELEPRILALFKEIVEKDEQGLPLPFDTKASTVSIVQASAAGTLDLAVSRSSPYVKNVYVARRPGDCNNNMTVLNSGFPCDGLKGAQLNIQSIHVPNYGPAEGIDLMNVSLQGGHGSSACNSLMSYPFSYKDYYGNNTFETPSSASYALEDAFEISNGTMVVNFSLEKDIDSEYDLDGLDSSALGATFNITLQEDQIVGGTAGNAATRSVLTTFKYLRILTLKNGIISIAG